MRIVPFEPWHLGLIEPRWPNADIADGTKLQYGRFYQRAGPAWSGVHHGKVIVASGIVMLWPGVVEAWLFASDGIKECKIAFHKAVVRMMEGLMRDANLHRIQTSCHSEYATSRKWLERLGFQCEGLMAGYAPDGTDYYRYAYVRTK